MRSSAQRPGSYPSGGRGVVNAVTVDLNLVVINVLQGAHVDTRLALDDLLARLGENNESVDITEIESRASVKPTARKNRRAWHRP